MILTPQLQQQTLTNQSFKSVVQGNYWSSSPVTFFEYLGFLLATLALSLVV